MLWILLIIIVALLLYIVVLYNKLVGLRLRVKNAWAQIEVQLKRRHDLIPNLVNAVKGYMKYEQDTLTKVIEARAKAVSATAVPDIAKAEGELSGLLSKLFALFENYPELKANQNVMALQEELTTTENQISFSRQHYNDSVMVYNMALQMFPSNIIASTFNFKEEDKFFEAPEAEKEVPKVDLSL
ncbi:MAG: hypothetical protein A2Y62_08700 [Candidatus Fischerbacteria bacterium RBG_13_37_8]|uniref:LemA family protein n=1 Tax=Candidatus Fischerbacteria bacterium RBG_13_37_8 TaxID=1817863 RepID=A0A1F5VR24_9BACT|nr:MAG: hypothetical protein A2Y62_08700 [Candidatus Fischerbacteria bacterium RBG_13_37_8]